MRHLLSNLNAIWGLNKYNCLDFKLPKKSWIQILSGIIASCKGYYRIWTEWDICNSLIHLINFYRLTRARQVPQYWEWGEFINYWDAYVRTHTLRIHITKSPFDTWILLTWSTSCGCLFLLQLPDFFIYLPLQFNLVLPLCKKRLRCWERGGRRYVYLV